MDASEGEKEGGKWEEMSMKNKKDQKKTVSSHVTKSVFSVTHCWRDTHMDWIMEARAHAHSWFSIQWVLVDTLNWKEMIWPSANSQVSTLIYVCVCVCVFSSSQWLPMLTIYLFIFIFFSTNYVILRSCVMDLFLASVHTWQENKGMFLFPSHFIPFVSSPVSCLCTTHKLSPYLPNNSLVSRMDDQHQENWKKHKDRWLEGTIISMYGRSCATSGRTFHLSILAFCWFCFSKSSTQVE